MSLVAAIRLAEAVKNVNKQLLNKCKQTSNNNKNVNKPAEAKYWQTAKQAASNSSTEKMAFSGEGCVAFDNNLCKK